jgi:peptide/nickel transport system permease protein
MQRYILIRAVWALVALWAVSILVFGLARITGDPTNTLLSFEATDEQREIMKAYWGLDKPLPEQYAVFIGNIFQGDLGDSFKWRQPVTDLVRDRFPNTIMLALLAIAVASVIAIPMGVLSAVKRDSIFDSIGKSIALVGQSAPPFWVGLVLMWIFAVQLDLVPTSGKGGVTSFILPTLALGLFWVAALMRLIRSAMLDVLDSEYVKLARIKGLAEWRVIWKHVLRNAAIAPLTYFAITLGSLMVGSVSIETVFQWPGLGFLLFNAARASDYALLQGIMLTFTSIYIIANLLVDIAYAYLDPRIRYT